jgi:hypothetical protein
MTVTTPQVASDLALAPRATRVRRPRRFQNRFSFAWSKSEAFAAAQCQSPHQASLPSPDSGTSASMRSKIYLLLGFAGKKPRLATPCALR